MSSRMVKFRLSSSLWLMVLVYVSARIKMQLTSRVFVAGSTGRLGQRCVKQLINEGFSVAAGCRKDSIEKAHALFPSAAQVVTYDLSDERSLQQAVEGYETIICALGASESDVGNIYGPYTVDGVYTKNLIIAAKGTPSVRHFILITSLGTAKFGMPAAILNLFWGVLKWKRESELALINSGIPFTIIRPGGMERPTDEYEVTHNVLLTSQDKLFGGQISRLQVAKLTVAAVKNPNAASGKVIEAIAETDAPKVSYTDLLQSVKSSKSELDWKEQLSPQEFYILRQEGTERPWTSPLNEEKRSGTFKCAGCGQPLFGSNEKFESGTGWPSFYSPISKTAVKVQVDMKIGLPRNEVRCESCDGHLGHVFDDGPRPTGKRYCINGAAMHFEPIENA